MGFWPFDNGIANAYIHYRWDRIAWCVGVVFQREITLLPDGVIWFYNRITLHMSVRHCITWDKNTSRDIVLHVMNPTGDISHYQVIPLWSSKWHNECIHSPSMRPYCVVFGNHFSTWDKHSRSFFIILGHNFPFLTRRQILYYLWRTHLHIFHIFKGFPFLSNKWLNECIYSLWTTAYSMVCRSHFQREIWIPGVISLYHIITPHMMVWESFHNGVISSYLDITPLLKPTDI